MVAAAIAIAGSEGCKSLGRQVFEEPIVTLRDVRLVGFGATGGEIDVVLGIYNPNGFRLDANRITYRMYADTSLVGTGALDSRFTVQEGDSLEVRLPVRFTYAGLGAAGSQIRNSGTLNYRVAGDITVATPIGNFTRPYDQTGRYTLFGRDEH
jgi:LEA14-like dessication related protein